MILHLCPDGHGGLSGLHLGGGQRAPLLHVDRSGLDQPHVPVDAGALIEPAVAQSRIHPDQQHVRSAGQGEIGQVEAERIVAAAVPADVVAIEDDHRFPVGAVELDRDPPAGIGGGQVEDAAVPAHAGLRVVAPQRVGALAGQRRVVLERQFDGPVVRQVHRLPVAVVVGQVAGGKETAGLLEATGPAGAETEVLAGVIRVAEVEPPAEIQQQALARRRRSRGPRLSGLDLRCHPGHRYSSGGGGSHAAFQYVAAG